MIKIRLYTATGERGAQVGLALRAGDVSTRLWRALQDPEQVRKSGYHIRDMDRLASGELPLSKIASLYDGDEIEQAIKRRLEEMGQEGAELSALRELLHSGAWAGANGGAGSTRSREATMRSDWRTLTDAKKSRSSDTSGVMIKSSRVGSAVDVAVANGWEARDARKSMGPQVLVHGDNPGVEIHIGAESEWEMKRGAKTLAKSEGSSPAQNATGLLAHLTKFHGR